MGSVRTKQLGALDRAVNLESCYFWHQEAVGKFFGFFELFLQCRQHRPTSHSCWDSGRANSEPTGPWCHIKYQEIHSAVKSTF